MQTNGAPGTAALYEMFTAYIEVREKQDQRLTDYIAVREKQDQRIRAMLFSMIDDYERELGFGLEGKPPRNAQVRQFWRECGEPQLTGG